MFDCTTITNRLWTVSWSDYSHPTGVVNLRFMGPTFLLPQRLCNQKDKRWRGHKHLIQNFCPPLSRKRGDIKSHSSGRPSLCLSVRPSVRHKNFNLGHIFCTITDRALILGMCVLCDKTFPMVPCHDLGGDLWPTSRSNLLPSGGPQFSEFACYWL